ncbi:MAG: hypothetical protein WAW79_11985 [Steroidobacteraceae bacterium]
MITLETWWSMSSSIRTDEPVGIAERILVLRGQRVLLDADLAASSEVPGGLCVSTGNQ